MVEDWTPMPEDPVSNTAKDILFTSVKCPWSVPQEKHAYIGYMFTEKGDNHAAGRCENIPLVCRGRLAVLLSRWTVLILVLR